jgi:ADP-L-glycero-D-manno-heptose 6-epimerase
VATVNACRKAEGRPPATLGELAREGAIEYIAFPPQLVGRYQSYTQADLTLLRGAGCKVEMAPVEEGVAAYVERLMADRGASPVT